MSVLRLGLIVIASAAACVHAGPAEVRLADKGEARCVIVVPPGAMVWKEMPTDRGYTAEGILEIRRRLQRDSVADLALYLGKMSGAKIDVVEGLPAGEKRTPIYIGAEAQKVFGPVGKTKVGLFAFRVVAGRKGVGLYGEAEYGTSYAIYELLHRLGCRWFMPTDLGECVPSLSTLTVPEMDEALAPATEARSMNQGGDDWLRRNRMNWPIGGQSTEIIWIGGNQGGLESRISPEQLAAHPEWCLQVGGKPDPRYLRWTRQDVADAIADSIINELATKQAAALKAGMRVGVNIIPADRVVPDDDPEEKKADPEPRVWEPAAGRWSVTDRYILLANRVAERVGKKYPTVLFGVLAYVNMSMPPARYPVHPNLEVTIAPIDFNRMHPMTWTNHPNEYWLRDMVQGWGKKAARLNAYWYGMNLAEISAPNPFITKWGTDIPLLLENHMTVWAPETMGGWESMLPGYVLASRMTFYGNEKADDILQDLWTRFYGPAAEPMGRYWQRIDQAWTGANEYAGAHWGYLKMFTPEVLAGARADISEALKRAGKPDSLEYRRVKLIDESLGLFEQYMKMRRDWATANLKNLGADYATWISGLSNMVDRYKNPADHTYVQGRFGTFEYPQGMLAPPYKAAAKIEAECVRLGEPMLEWKWKHNPGPEVDSLPWTVPGFSDTNWPTTQVARDTWSSLGHHNTMTEASANKSGRMAYRASQKLAAVPAGKKAFLWIGSTDGSAKLFVNGQHVKYPVPEKTAQNNKGDLVDSFYGYCQPALFDVTGVLSNGVNQFTILCERGWLNELGTGGLMGPVVLYREK
jgi:hypothetical protein